jgi:alcohol dehydrogenase class IV
MNFEFVIAPRIIFGIGASKQAGPLAREFGKRALVVTGSSPSRAASLIDNLNNAGVASETFSIDGEPRVADIAAGLAKARSVEAELVIGFGGGSAIDGAKAIAALFRNPGELLEYLEVIGGGKALELPAIPCIAIPTTAGAGAEVTKNAVLASPEHKVKVSLRGPFLVPTIAMIDPSFAYSLPADITANTGLDALTQLIEPYLSDRANPLTDNLCVEGISRIARSLEAACLAPEAPGPREDMALASLLSGIALTNAGLGAVHGFAAPIGGMFNAPHGGVCAALLPHVMRANYSALSRKDPANPRIQRFNHIAALLTSNPGATAEDGINHIQALCHRLKIPPLSAYGIVASDFKDLIEKAEKASSMRANPVKLTKTELKAILSQASTARS